MPDKEKVIKWMEWLLENMVDPFNDFRLFEYDGPIVLANKPIIADAIALLKAQEPRVMAWDEVRAAMKAPIWKETKSMHKALYQGWVLTYDIQKGQGITGTRLGMAEPSGRVVWYKFEDYGKTWRLWTAEPTEAERQKEPWNG